ncbi:MAG: OadG family protein [Bacteroidales bacterium]|nr:OadG family protein [Bacteroidales bacterium]
MIINNIHIDSAAVDSEALIVTVVGYAVVFAALILLFVAFFSMPKILNLKFKRKGKSQIAMEASPVVEMSGEVNAAISMALHLYFNQYHDEESSAMTIKRESRLYSPWSSKIYQVRNQFNRI